jgi:hypothetical protein
MCLFCAPHGNDNTEAYTGSAASPYAGTAPVAHDAVIRVYDTVCNVIETHEHKGDFKEA